MVLFRQGSFLKSRCPCFCWSDFILKIRFWAILIGYMMPIWIQTTQLNQVKPARSEQSAGVLGTASENYKQNPCQAKPCQSSLLLISVYVHVHVKWWPWSPIVCCMFLHTNLMCPPNSTRTRCVQLNWSWRKRVWAALPPRSRPCWTCPCLAPAALPARIPQACLCTLPLKMPTTHSNERVIAPYTPSMFCLFKEASGWRYRLPDCKSMYSYLDVYSSFNYFVWTTASIKPDQRQLNVKVNLTNWAFFLPSISVMATLQDDACMQNIYLTQKWTSFLR